MGKIYHKIQKSTGAFGGPSLESHSMDISSTYQKRRCEDSDLGGDKSNLWVNPTLNGDMG